MGEQMPQATGRGRSMAVWVGIGLAVGAGAGQGISRHPPFFCFFADSFAQALAGRTIFSRRYSL